MSGIIVQTQTAKIALAAASPRTVLQIQAPSNHRVRILGWGVFFDGATASAVPAEVRVLRQTTSGTMTSGAPKEVLTPSISETPQVSTYYNATAEPAAGGGLDMVMCHPQQGYEVRFPPGQEPIIEGGGRVGIEVTAPAVVNVRAKFIYEE